MSERDDVESMDAILGRDDYTFLHNAYYGTGGFKDGSYLINHPRETPEKYLTRKRLSYYLNYIASVVNSHVNPVFRTEPERGWDENPLFSIFVESADTIGTPLTRLMKRAGRIAKLQGSAFIVLDNVSDQPGNIAEVLKKRALPYAYVVTKKQVITCKTDKAGNLIEFSYTVAAEISSSTVTKTETWTWTRTTWTCQGADGTIRSGDHNLGEVPVVPLLSRPMDPSDLMPQSEFYNIARTNLRLFNLCSEIDELIRNQAFNILTYPASDGQTQDDVKEITVGTENVMSYDGQLSGKPEFIAPDAAPLQQLREERSDLIQEIYRMAELSHVTGVEAKTSGVAKQWDFEQANQVLADFALNCQDAEKKLAHLFELWTKTKVNFSCLYSDDFGIIDVSAALDEVSKALDLNISPEFNAEAKKKAVIVFLNDIPEDRYDAVIADIEARAQDEKYATDTTQIADALQLLTNVSTGQVAPEAAVVILQVFFGMDKEKAQQMIDAQKNIQSSQVNTDVNAA